MNVAHLMLAQAGFQAKPGVPGVKQQMRGKRCINIQDGLDQEVAATQGWVQQEGTLQLE